MRELHTPTLRLLWHREDWPSGAQRWGGGCSGEVLRERGLRVRLLRAALFPRSLEGQGYQNSAIDQSFWETFGSTDPAKAHRSPSSDSWTCADASAEKRSSDSWDMWGAGSASNHRASDNSDGAEGPAKPTGRAAPRAAQVDEGWDDQDW